MFCYPYKQVLDFLLLDSRDENDLFGLRKLPAEAFRLNFSEAQRTELRKLERALRENRQTVRIMADALVFWIPLNVLMLYIKLPAEAIDTWESLQLFASTVLAMATVGSAHLAHSALGLWCALRMAAFVIGLMVLSKATFDLVVPLVSSTLGTEYALSVVYTPMTFVLMKGQYSRFISKIERNRDDDD